MANLGVAADAVALLPALAVLRLLHGEPARLEARAREVLDLREREIAAAFDESDSLESATLGERPGHRLD